MTNLTRC